MNLKTTQRNNYVKNVQIRLGKYILINLGEKFSLSCKIKSSVIQRL